MATTTFTGPVVSLNGFVGDIDLPAALEVTSLTVDTTATVTGVLTATGGVVGNLTGNVTGNVTGTIISSRAVLAATGTNAATAAVIATQIVAVTASDGTTAVALPAAATTTAPILVINTVTTATLPVFPISGGNDNINAGAEDAAWTLGPGRSAWFTPTSATQWYVDDVSSSLPTTTELNYNDIATLGTLAASKAWTSDASLDTVMPTGGLLTVQSGGAVTLNSGSTFTNNASTVSTATAAEHGAGAIGTGAAPQTFRWTDRGIVITQTLFDLQGLASVATANDVIGLAAGGAAYIGRNVVATNGVIFKVELSCLETPATGDNDVNVVANSSASLAYDDAGGTTYLSNSGDLLAGQTIQNLVPALTANDYYYITAGTGDTAATYTAGQYVLTTYGRALLA